MRCSRPRGRRGDRGHHPPDSKAEDGARRAGGRRRAAGAALDGCSPLPTSPSSLWWMRAPITNPLCRAIKKLGCRCSAPPTKPSERSAATCSTARASRPRPLPSVDEAREPGTAGREAQERTKTCAAPMSPALPRAPTRAVSAEVQRDGTISYGLKTARRGRTHRVMAPLEFMARLAALIPHHTFANPQPRRVRVELVVAPARDAKAARRRSQAESDKAHVLKAAYVPHPVAGHA